MKHLVWLGFLVISASVFGQRPNGANTISGHPNPSQHPALSSGLPPVGAIPPLSHSTVSTQRFDARRPFRPSSRGFGYGGYPYLGGDVYPAEPDMPFAEPPPPPARYVIMQAPPPPVRPEIHEYGSVYAAGAEPVEQEPPAFTIALADGTTRSAVAVAVQGGALMYVEEDGGQARIALDTIDRDATRRLNRAKGLDLRLPPPET
jgi:hypothetical protein